MSNAVFPSLVKGLTFTQTKTPEFATIVQASPGGSEVRLPQMQNPRWHYQLMYDYIYDHWSSPQNTMAYAPYTDFATMMGFFLARQGQNDSFLYTDPEDNFVGPAMNGSSPNPLAQLQLVNDGAGHYYSPLQRNLGGLFQEDITDLNGALTVYANGVKQNDAGSGTLGAYTLNGPGLALPGYSFRGLYLQWNAGAGAAWQASYAYALNATILDAAGHIQKATTAGTSGATQPSWNDAGGHTTEGGVAWKDLGTPAVWAATTAYALGAVVKDPSGHLQLATTGGTSGSSTPSWNDSGSTTADGLAPLDPACSIGTWQYISGVATLTVTGTTTYHYVVVGKNGSTVIGITATGATSQAAATLSGSVFNAITWSSMAGATSYDIYRTYGGSTRGKIASGTVLFLNDTGLSGDSTSPPPNEVVWQDQGTPTWTASHAYAVNAPITDGAGHVQQVTVASTSGSSAPTFNDSGGTTNDGAITWADQGYYSGPAVPITAEFNFYFRLRFETDSQDYEKFMNNLWTIGGSAAKNGSGILKMISARPAGV